MKKLAFLVGKWSGEARMFRGTAEPVVIAQTEEVQYKLDGLALLIEGVGRASGGPALQALGVVSYDDEAGTYHMRAFNDGRFLETEVKLLAEGQGMSWGFAVGQYRTSAVLRIDGKGNWTELHELSVGGQAPRRFMELSVSREK